MTPEIPTIVVQQGTVIKQHLEDPNGESPPHDLYYLVTSIKPVEESEFLYGFKGPAMFVSLLEAVPEKGGNASHSYEAVPKNQFDPTTGAVRIDAQGYMIDGSVTTYQAVDPALVPQGLVFMAGEFTG
jgi:hypothetical protein